MGTGTGESGDWGERASLDWSPSGKQGRGVKVELEPQAKARSRWSISSRRVESRNQDAMRSGDSERGSRMQARGTLRGGGGEG